MLKTLLSPYLFGTPLRKVGSGISPTGTRSQPMLGPKFMCAFSLQLQGGTQQEDRLYCPGGTTGHSCLGAGERSGTRDI